MRPFVNVTLLRRGDPLLLLAATVLGLLGLALVTSATWHYVDHPSLIGNIWTLRHLLFVVAGLAAMFGLSLVQPRILLGLAYPAYGAALLILVAVALIGQGSAEHGAYAQRWIEIAGVQIQPSEPAKLGLILALARLYAGSVAPGFRRLAASAAITAVPVVLVYLQPDLGTALSMGAIWMGIVVLSGVPKRYVYAIVALGIAGMPLMWVNMHGYMRERVLTFLNPEAYALGEGYNLLQAQISIGSGGMWGKGLFEGTQTQLRYLRLSHSDFIFSVLGEELGFVGALALLGLFLFLLFRILRAYDVGDGRFASLMCAGVASLIAFQMAANISGNVGLSPAVGIPLPFISHGGSALVSNFAALGLVQAALAHRRPAVFSRTPPS
jgi:rod shape determining protein RodA